MPRPGRQEVSDDLNRRLMQQLTRGGFDAYPVIIYILRRARDEWSQIEICEREKEPQKLGWTEFDVVRCGWTDVVIRVYDEKGCREIPLDGNVGIRVVK